MREKKKKTQTMIYKPKFQDTYRLETMLWDNIKFCSNPSESNLHRFEVELHDAISWYLALVYCLFLVCSILYFSPCLIPTLLTLTLTLTPFFILLELIPMSG